MTGYQLAAMDRAGEHGEPIFRAPSVGGSGNVLSDEKIDAAVQAWFASYDSYYEPSFRERMRAAIAATAATGEPS